MEEEVVVSFEETLAKANAGDAEAQNAMGRHLASSGSRAEAEDWFRRAAQQGLAKAKHNLGVLYWNENNGSREAEDWFRSAAQDGWLPSIFVLGAMLEKRDELETARRFYLAAAQRGHAGSQDAMSRLHFDQETAKDDEIARYWAERAAEQGIVAAIARLGLIYHEGRGVPRAPSRAAAFFLEAANLGHHAAQLMIGVALHMGIGVPVDRIEAAHWILRSAEQGVCASLSRGQGRHERRDAGRA